MHERHFPLIEEFCSMGRKPNLFGFGPRTRPSWRGSRHRPNTPNSKVVSGDKASTLAAVRVVGLVVI